jgi:2,3-bisphosphoglycerate-independent phosphoglycerate mutase
VHSHIDHLLALLTLCHEKNFNRVYIDAITDGTDSGSTDALKYIEKIENKIKDVNLGKINSIGGRFWAMDRDGNWDRVLKYYNMLIGKNPTVYPNVKKAITDNYTKGINDEFIAPGMIQNGNAIVPLKKDDAVIMFNFREDRSRQLARVIIDKKAGTIFSRPRHIEDLYFATFINYKQEIPAKIVFPCIECKNSLSEVLSKANIGQLKIAESQKYAHVTYFFNGGSEDPFVGEDRKIIPSLDTDSFDKVPEMSAKAITKATLRAIESGKHELIVVNFANVDMVAHTGNILATGKAVQIIDRLVRVITGFNLKHNGATIITADHGNAEQMVQLKRNTSQKETLHTLNPVPFILITPKNRKNLIQSATSHHSTALAKIIGAKDSLADIAPTILELMELPKPPEMTGHSLLNRLE